MKGLFVIFIFFQLGCSTSIEGLWIDKDENVILKFSSDSVILSNLRFAAFRDTLSYIRTRDSLSWMGINPELNDGNTHRTFRYILAGDSLQIWFEQDNKYVYYRSDARDYMEHFLSKGDIQINLPTSENSRQYFTGYEPLTVRIGFSDDEVKVFVQDVETPLSDLDRAIKNFVNREEMYDVFPSEIFCQLFIDERIPCEYTFEIFDNLRANGIRRVTFVTLNRNYNPNTSDFYGLGYLIPFRKMNIVEENEH